MNKSKLAYPITEELSLELAVEENQNIPLTAVMALFAELNQKDVRYCHWKSNSRLDWGLAGKTDLDLLVDFDQEALFKQILQDHGIKEIIPPEDKQYPGLEHFLGYDQKSGRLFHLHVHFNLVLGEQFVKNYRVPIEKQYLDRTRTQYGVKIPIPELELIILSIRALLKYRDRDVIKDGFSIRSPGIPDHIRLEILWLLDQSSVDRVEDVLASLAIFQDQAIFPEFLKLMKEAPRSGWKLFNLRARVRKELRAQQRQTRFSASTRYLNSMLKNSKLFRGRSGQSMVMPKGGKLIALIGIDGSGKSTLGSDLANWLEWKVSAPLHYLGSKQPSRWSDWSYLVFRMFRRSNTELSRWLDDDNFLIRIIQRFRQFFLGLHYLSVGRDRYRRYRIAKKEAGEGSVVIFDRFPFVAPLDGPEIHLISEGKLFPLTRKLSEIEKNLYRKFDFLDLVIVLNVDPEVSIVRKPDHSLETIIKKNETLAQLKAQLSSETSDWDWVPIDANEPVEQVFHAIKTAVWSAL